ncbi:MAG: tetratricopeptide repeat protein [Alphaproteobacteria bacterium]
MIHRLLILTVLLVFMPLTSLLAQSAINVRVGEHDDYTRLVFDWPQNVGYKITDQTNDSLTLNFDAAGRISTNIDGDNLRGIELLDENPMRVRLQIPSGANSRVFALASRVVVDIYAPENMKTAQKTPASQPQQAPKPSRTRQEPEKTAEKAPPEADENELQRVQDAIQNLDGVVAKVLNDEEARKQTSKAPQESAEPQGLTPVNPSRPSAPQRRTVSSVADNQIQPHKFTLSSTQSIGMAVFNSYGTLWLVTDKANLFVKPQISGPDAEYFRPIKEMALTDGKAYTSKTRDGNYIIGQGSGLLWNVIVTPEKVNDENYKPVEPQRVDVAENQTRSGKIIWPLSTARNVLDVKDPYTGSTLKVITVEDAQDFAGGARSFVDFDVLESSIGLAIRPKTENLQVRITDQGVEIFREDGLAILPPDKVAGIEKESFEDRMKRNPNERRIFNFDEWRMGGLNVLNENESVILASLPDMTEGTKIENLITLAKMQLSNGRGAEALGFLKYAERELPELVQNPEFMSLRGVAKAFAWKTDEAFRDLSAPLLKDYEEIQIWRAFTLADLGDWQQAREVLPDNIAPIRDYPPEILNRAGVVLAEIYLRAGEVKKAEQLFNIKEDDELNTANAAALQYLQGEAARQKGDLATTKKLWQELTEGKDDLYRVKAGLALTRLLMEEKSITPGQAIDRLERLRYAWRGDELEAQVNYWLGRTYFENGDYVKGLNIMREAASLVPDTILGQRITRDMSKMFTEFFLDKEELKDISPLDSVALYEQFQELVPSGEEGSRLISNLAEHMVQADLLDRASDLLKYQIDHRLSGDEAARTATRLAAINLIDKNPRDALSALNKSVGFLKNLPGDVATKGRFEELSLLRARALSMDGKTDQALAILETLNSSPEVNRLRADIAWQSGFWDDAAYALEDVILDENISLTRPLSDDHAMLILQRAVAQNLSGDRIGLANLREKYGEAMSQTNKARLFDVVSRPRKASGLADRETLLSTVAEIDLFGEFLNSYRDVNQSPSN